MKLQYQNYFLGAQERCDELGYQLEEFRLNDLDRSFRRLSKILWARNIQGLLFPPQQDRQRHITKANFGWENFSMISFGFSLMRPRLDVVTNAQFASCRMAVRELRSLGYRRIGLAIERRSDERSEQNFLAGFLIEQRRFLRSECVPMFFADKQDATARLEKFGKWFSSQKPDVILAVSGEAPDYYLSLNRTERKQCGLAIMDVPDNNTELSGINQNNVIIGRTAVDMLVAKIHLNERGIPDTPRRILIEGRWLAGTTAPRITGK